MLNISNFLEKFKGIGAEGYVARTSLSKILKSDYNIHVPIEDIEWKGAILKINASPIVKSQIYIKKHTLLERVRESVPSLRIVSIE